MWCALCVKLFKLRVRAAWSVGNVISSITSKFFTCFTASVEPIVQSNWDSHFCHLLKGKFPVQFKLPIRRWFIGLRLFKAHILTLALWYLSSPLYPDFMSSCRLCCWTCLAALIWHWSRLWQIYDCYFCNIIVLKQKIALNSIVSHEVVYTHIQMYIYAEPDLVIQCRYIMDMLPQIVFYEYSHSSSLDMLWIDSATYETKTR